MQVSNLNNYNYTVNRIHKEKIKEKEAAEWLNVFLKKIVWRSYVDVRDAENLVVR